MAYFAFFIFALFMIPRSTFQFPEEGNEEETLHEGDIKLSLNQELALELFGDPTAPVLGARGITKDQNLLWDKLVVPYNISRELDENPTAKSVILSAMVEWEQSSCLKFVRRTTEKDYIEFFKGGGCWSYVGRQGGMQQISLASGCWYQGTVVHEIGHAMGFWHEQSRPDRDEHVTIIWENIPEKKKHNFRKYNRTQVDSLGVPYDYLSVMHYSSTAFGINGSTTIVAVDSSVIQLGQRIGLSPSDVKQADLLYGCNGKTTRPAVIPSPQPPPTGPDDCTFENGTCGFTNVDGDDFDWTIRMGKTPSGRTGPETDHTTLRFGFFMYIETSKPRQPGDVAILQSKPFLPSGERCLQFYYHMYGDHIGTLRVLYSSDGIDTQIWERKQEQGNQWLLARANLPSNGNSPYTIKFVGIRGDSYQGDIAIDDIFFTDGKCRGA
ncbi:meprin A subunit beta-like [Oculina patagonica]